MDSFYSEWTKYLKQIEFSEDTVLKANKEASSKLNQKAIQQKLSLDCWIFTGYILSFTKNSNKLDKPLLGVLELKSLGKKRFQLFL